MIKDKFIFIENSEFFNTSEAMFGDVLWFGSSIIIPYFSAFLMREEKEYLGNYDYIIGDPAISKSVKYSYLVFEGISNIFRAEDHQGGEFTSSDYFCFGMSYFNERYDNSLGHEILVRFKKSKVILHTDYQVRDFIEGFQFDEEVEHFFEVIARKEVYEIRDYLLSQRRS